MVQAATVACLVMVSLAGLVCQSSAKLNMEELRGKPMFTVMEILMKRHPAETRHVLDKLVNLIPDDNERKAQMQKVDELYADTRAMDSTSCLLCKVKISYK